MAEHALCITSLIRSTPLRVGEEKWRHLQRLRLGFRAKGLPFGIREFSTTIEIMKVLTVIARTLLGLVFVVFGSNAFLHFIPMPPMSGHAGEFIGSMYATGYLPIIAVFQVAGGLLLLIGRFVPLGLTLLGPIIVNILLYHVCMDRSGLPMALVISAVSLFLLWRYREAFAGVFRA